jgi:hypothetical protein
MSLELASKCKRPEAMAVLLPMAQAWMRAGEGIAGWHVSDNSVSKLSE